MSCRYPATWVTKRLHPDDGATNGPQTTNGYYTRTGLVLRGDFHRDIPYQHNTFNAVLTGARIVRYDGAAIIGSSTGTSPGSSAPAFFGDGRIAYAPVEDLLFGFALVLATLAWWVFWGRRGVQATNPVGRD